MIMSQVTCRLLDVVVDRRLAELLADELTRFYA